MKITKRHILAIAALMLLSGCSSESPSTETAQTTVTASEAEQSVTEVTPPMQDHPSEEGEDETVSIYFGKQVEKEEDLAIFKISGDIPEGWDVIKDDKEAKMYSSNIGSIRIFGQNFKEEFQSLDVFADQGCAGIKVNNMMFQADTEFSDPVKTTVAGFDAIRYDYTVTAYEFLYETEADGSQKLNDDGTPILTNEKIVAGKYYDRVYYFYSDEDAFYIMVECPEPYKDQTDPIFDAFIDSVKVN